ncbi:MAG: hypothetical protein LKF61_00895 [Eggerthellaceae bacterium]|jgi:predicted RNA-binding Zn-ribbon protein involved in translation (DUF1610 family)|nr:hypothetical protein [Eggerthellaceae bacterium]MCH4220474.1 hypothetical protein [Eggerthellaceae bacterium]
MNRTSKHCPNCGASKCYWSKKPSRLVDLSTHFTLETDLAGLADEDAITCDKCGFEGVVRRFYPEAEGYYDLRDEYCYAPRYCPHCGAKVVRDDA